MTAISDQVEILNYEVHARSVTFDIFNFFIAPLAAIVHGKDIVLIMENVPSHKNVENVYTEVVFKKLPPHSLFLNPIEKCFSAFKAYLKQHLNGRGVVNACESCTLYRLLPSVQTVSPAVHQRLRTSVTRDDIARRSSNYVQCTYLHLFEE